MEHYCVDCGKIFGVGYHPLCDVCDGLVDVRYQLAGVQLPGSTNPYERFAALLPLDDGADRFPRDARYSPTVHAQGLGSWLGMPGLFLKYEGGHPTGSTKDRMAAVALAYLWERGVREFCTSSTDNSSSAYAYALAGHPGMRLNLFTAQAFADRVSYADVAQVTHHCLRDATFVDAFYFAGTYARHQGWSPNAASSTWAGGKD